MKPWPRRKLVLEAILLLPLARLLVRFVRIGRWKNTLASPPPCENHNHRNPDGLELAAHIGRSVERAGWRMGGSTKCLPKAIVAVWMLHRRKIAARLVIASVRNRHEGDADPLHAWVEVNSTMIIGHCDRALYLPLATFGEQHTIQTRPERPPREAF